MNKKINAINLLSLGLIVFSVICLIFRTVAILTAFDSHIGYFDRNSVIIYFDRSFFAVAIIFGIVISFLTSKAAVSKSLPANLWSTFSSLLFGFIWAICTLLFVILLMPKASTLVYVAIAGSAGSAIYFIYEGFRPIKTLSIGRSIASLIPMIAFLSIILIENFDFYIAFNAPDKQLVMFVFILAALYLIQKLKFSTEAPTSKLYICSAYLTIFISIYFAVPGIIGNLTHVTDSPKYLVYYMLSLGTAIYAIIDFIGHIKLSSFENDLTIESLPEEK